MNNKKIEKRKKKRISDNQRNYEIFLEEKRQLEELNKNALKKINLTENEEKLLKNNNYYRRYPHLALLSFCLSSNDPRIHICNDESMEDENRAVWNRIKSILEKPPFINIIKQTQKEINKCLNSNSPI